MASLKFVRQGSHDGIFKSGGIKIYVTNTYNNNVGGETEEMQADKVRRLLAGERGLRAVYSNRNGESDVSIYGDFFELGGGEYGPTFGHRISIRVSYSENKAAIDAFLAFMLENGRSDSD
jgi:hypothetical protein